MVAVNLLPGYSKNFYQKGDEILVMHAHEMPSLPATPYPCKKTFGFFFFFSFFMTILHLCENKSIAILGELFFV